MSSAPTGIEVTAKIFPLAFIALLFKVVVEIDGQTTEVGWSKPNFLPTTAGTHQVTISWKYFFVLPVNKASVSVTVAEGQTAHILYKARWLIFLAGLITVS